MKINDYPELASRTLAEINPESIPDLKKFLNNMHMILGMMTELGELADIFKKHLAYGKEIDWVNVREEIGDGQWYAGGMCKINLFDLENIMENNINKLKSRYPEKFSQEKALNRDLERERKILEKLGYN
jgi:NTP pyrophosphatase (non-canonical NTP hydrolase)